MAKIAYFDCFSGVSGDMVLGAALDLGLPIEALRSALGSLAIEYGGISAERVLRAGVSATRFRAAADDHPVDVDRATQAAHTHTAVDDQRSTQTRQHLDAVQGGAVAGAHSHSHSHSHSHGHSHSHSHDHEHEHGGHEQHAAEPDHDHQHEPHEHGREPHDHDHAHQHHGGHASGHSHHSLTDIARYIERSALSSSGKARALHLFETLATAEAAIHDMPLDRIHLHEVGALDSIIDIVGAVFAMEWLAADTVVVSPLNVGSGTVWCAHGQFPVPAPATARLLTGVPIYAGAIARELVTPTGALLMASYATRFGPLPEMTVNQIGYGAGSRDFKQHPNVLRVMVGEAAPAGQVERIVVMECEIDDMNPQLFGPLMDRLYEAGALDVYYAAVHMKKNRPGTLVTVLAAPEQRAAVASVLFSDSTTIGVRYHEVQRERLDRATETVETPAGPIRFKVASRDGRVMNAAPEFDDCARAAASRGLSIKDVQAMAVRAWVDARAAQGES